jgi:hypothetical protein
VAILVGVEKFFRQVSCCADSVLHPGNADAYAFAIFVTAIQVCGVRAAVAVLRAVAAALWQRRGKQLCPRRKLVEVVADFAGHFRQGANRPQHFLVIAACEPVDDALHRNVLIR